MIESIKTISEMLWFYIRKRERFEGCE